MTRFYARAAYKMILMAMGSLRQLYADRWAAYATHLAARMAKWSRTRHADINCRNARF